MNGMNIKSLHVTKRQSKISGIVMCCAAAKKADIEIANHLCPVAFSRRGIINPRYKGSSARAMLTGNKNSKNRAAMNGRVLINISAGASELPNKRFASSRFGTTASIAITMISPKTGNRSDLNSVRSIRKRLKYDFPSDANSLINITTVITLVITIPNGHHMSEAAHGSAADGATISAIKP